MEFSPIEKSYLEHKLEIQGTNIGNKEGFDNNSMGDDVGIHNNNINIFLI